MMSLLLETVPKCHYLSQETTGERAAWVEIVFQGTMIYALQT
jgi:hypothetical protein